MMRRAGKFSNTMGCRSLSGVIGALWSYVGEPEMLSVQLAESCSSEQTCLCFVISSMCALMLS